MIEKKFFLSSAVCPSLCLIWTDWAFYVRPSVSHLDGIGFVCPSLCVATDWILTVCFSIAIYRQIEQPTVGPTDGRTNQPPIGRTDRLRDRLSNLLLIRFFIIAVKAASRKSQRRRKKEKKKKLKKRKK